MAMSVKEWQARVDQHHQCQGVSISITRNGKECQGVSSIEPMVEQHLQCGSGDGP